jgi:spectinomycin phosphotransferase
LETKDGRLRTELAEFKLIVYPFVEGKNGYEVVLSEQQWAEFGSAFYAIHSVTLPPSFVQYIESETYAPFWRERVLDFLKQVEHDTFDDAIAAEAAAFLHSKRADVVYLVERAEELGYALQERAPKFVLCHNDMHGGNLLVTPQGALYLVDWDAPMLAPRERDLMFIGGGQGFTAASEDEAERLFYRGYGETQIDLGALAYFRFERILYDICVECERMFSGLLSAEDQVQSLLYLKWEWSPNFMIERAYHADKMRSEA